MFIEERIAISVIWYSGYRMASSTAFACCKFRACNSMTGSISGTLTIAAGFSPANQLLPFAQVKIALQVFRIWPTVAGAYLFLSAADTIFWISSCRTSRSFKSSRYGQPTTILLALRDGVVPPTLNLRNLDPEIDLDVVAGEPRRGKYEYAINNSFGFGGHNVALAFGKY